ncbi:MAG TPA: diguanylate cyclase, partial [Bacteroidota bacterium]
GTSGVQSALAVPVFFATGVSEITPVGLIVADSKAEDQFGNETLALLGRFTKLVSSLIKSYTDKYDLLLDSELLSSLRRMYDRIGTSPSEEAVLNCLTDEANRLATWESLGVIMYSEEQGGWVVQRAINKGIQPSVTPGLAIDPLESVVGEVIRSNTLRTIDDLTVGSPVRFHPSESAPQPGSFLCVPVSSFNRCYGALTLESRTPANYRGSEIETIYRLVQNAAALLEVIYMNDMTREHMPVDTLTGALNRKHFQRRLEEEVQRASDFGTDLALVSVAVDALDDHAQRYGAEGADAILAGIAHTLRSNIRPYDALGRQGENRLGVLLVQTTSGDAYLWAEKLRKQIAGQIINAGSRSLSVTVSMGIGGLMEGMKMEELASDTDQVLAKAMEHGGNLVRVH